MNKQTDFLLSSSRYPYVEHLFFARVGDKVLAVKGRPGNAPHFQPYHHLVNNPDAGKEGQMFLTPPQPTWTRPS